MTVRDYRKGIPWILFDLFLTIKYFWSPAMFVIGRCALIQHIIDGSFLWFRCASSARTEKPKKITKRPDKNMVQRPADTALRRGTDSQMTQFLPIKLPHPFSAIA